MHRSSSASKGPLFQAELKKQGTRLKSWSTRRCTVENKALRYSHRFGGSQILELTNDTFIHLDGTDIHITHAKHQHAPSVFRAPTRRIAMQLKAALLQEIGWQKSPKNSDEPAPAVDPDSVEHARSLKICQAAADGALEVLSQLVQTKEDIDNSITGATALHWACFEGKVECVQQLLSLGASLDVEDRTGMVPAETCAFLGNQNKRKVLGALAEEQHRRRKEALNWTQVVEGMHQFHDALSYSVLEHIIVDYMVGRPRFEAMQNQSDALLRPSLGVESRTDQAIQAFLNVKQLQQEAMVDQQPAAPRVDTTQIDSSALEQFACDFPPGTLGMYFMGKHQNSDVRIDQMAEDSIARGMGCREGDLLISVCGTDCRGRGLQHAVDCVLRTQGLPIRTFVFGRLPPDTE